MYKYIYFSEKMNNFIVLTVCTVLSIYLIQPTLQAAHTHTKSVSIFYLLHIFKYVLLEEFMSKSRMHMGPKSYVFRRNGKNSNQKFQFDVWKWNTQSSCLAQKSVNLVVVKRIMKLEHLHKFLYDKFNYVHTLWKYCNFTDGG